MRNLFRDGLFVVVGFCLSWGIIVGIFTWDSSRIFPAYANLFGWFMTPITMVIQNSFDKALKPTK